MTLVKQIFRHKEKFWVVGSLLLVVPEESSSVVSLFAAAHPVAGFRTGRGACHLQEAAERQEGTLPSQLPAWLFGGCFPAVASLGSQRFRSGGVFLFLLPLRPQNFKMHLSFPKKQVGKRLPFPRPHQKDGGRGVCSPKPGRGENSRKKPIQREAAN